MEFKDWFFKQFPEFYQASDTYKDIRGEGVFQRYLRTFGLELDENIMPFIDNFTDIVDYEKCDDKFLPLISYLLGSPPSFGNDNSEYRKILGYAIAIYKVKGTKRAYQLMFGILGLRVQVIEEMPRKQITYDMEPTLALYDDDEIYDSENDYCSGYRLAVTRNDNEEIEEEVFEKLEKVICFLQPINAKFLGFANAWYEEDTFEEFIEEEFTFDFIT